MKANDTVNTSETQSSQSSGFKNLEENELKEGNSKLQIEEVNDPSNSQLEKKSIGKLSFEIGLLFFFCMFQKKIFMLKNLI